MENRDGDIPLSRSYRMSLCNLFVIVLRSQRARDLEWQIPMSHVTQPLITLAVLTRLLALLTIELDLSSTPASYAFRSEGEKAQKLSKAEQ